MNDDFDEIKFVKMIVMKKEKYIRPCCTIIPFSTTLCDQNQTQFNINGSAVGNGGQFSREHSFSLEEETTTGWENE